MYSFALLGRANCFIETELKGQTENADANGSVNFGTDNRVRRLRPEFSIERFADHGIVPGHPHPFAIARNKYGIEVRCCSARDCVPVFAIGRTKNPESDMPSESGAAPRTFVSVQLARKTTIGPIREALCAGKYPASAATIISSAAIPMNVTGSPGVTPNNKLSSVPVRASEAAIPTARPRADKPS
jgi:hypothetical protein